MAADPNEAENKLNRYFGGAVGAGFVLVVLPGAALFLGIDYLNAAPVVGLPLIAIFGIMILFGALALTSTLFARLKLDDPSQALALPEGSIRAAIALALIVLFAIIAIMLYQSMSKPYVITGLTEAEKSTLVRDLSNRVIAVVPKCATQLSAKVPASDAASATTPLVDACGAAGVSYSIHVLQPPGQESSDLAKQLLILIGTLMTSVTSFYFGSRAAEPTRRAATSKKEAVDSAAGTNQTQADAELDACDGPIENPTSDEELPASSGGVTS